MLLRLGFYCSVAVIPSSPEQDFKIAETADIEELTNGAGKPARWATVICAEHMP